MSRILDDLIKRNPVLIDAKEDIWRAYLMMKECYIQKGKILVAGNGGSASDAEHICGELMKSFRLERRIPQDIKEKIIEVNNWIGKEVADNIECALPAIPLVSQVAFNTAFINDVGNDCVFAQQLFGLGNPGDVFLGLSTSGNSKNIVCAMILAKALGIKVIALTGRTGGNALKYSDVCVRIPADETYLIQELHLPIYHCLCMMLEEEFFGNETK